MLPDLIQFYLLLLSCQVPGWLQIAHCPSYRPMTYCGVPVFCPSASSFWSRLQTSDIRIRVDKVTSRTTTQDISFANYFGQLRKKTTMVHKIDVFWYTSIQNAENADRSPDLNSILFSCNQRGLDLFFIKGAAPDSINCELQWSPLELGCTRICTYTSFAIAEISVRKWLYKESKQMVQHYSILVIDEEIVDTVKS